MAKRPEIPALKDLKLLGVILKTHGYSGELVISLSFVPEKEIKKGEPVFVEIDGIPVPFFIDYFDVKTDKTAFIRFDDTDTSRKASSFTGCNIFTGAPVRESNESPDYSLSELEGYTVTDRRSGYSGILKELIDLQSHSLMQIECRGKDVLVPLHEDIIVSIDSRRKAIIIDAPEGLFEL